MYLLLTVQNILSSNPVWLFPCLRRLLHCESVLSKMYCRSAYLQLLAQCNSDLHSFSSSQHYPYMADLDPDMLCALGVTPSDDVKECALPPMAASTVLLRELNLGENI